MDKDIFRTPGQLIKALMAERGWTQRVLGIVLGLEDTAVNHILSGRRPVTADMSIILGEIFDVPAETILALQRDYDLAKARLEAMPDSGRTTRAQLFGQLPISDMVKRGWLKVHDIRDVSNVEQELASFFGAPSVVDIEILPHAAKKTETFEPATAVQIAWIYRVKQITSEMLVPAYTPERALQLAPKLQSLLRSPEEARKVPRLLAEHGIRFTLVETLPSAKIDGVCFWLDERSPVIAISTRYDRLDNFWFVLRHEIEHVLQRHGLKSVMLDAELEGDRAGTGPNIADEERLANAAAAEFCVPQAALEKFINKKAPYFNERDVIGFANTLNIHPGLVAGQLQRKTGRCEILRQHLAKIRDCVAPSAIVDGWGDIAPVGQ